MEGERCQPSPRGVMFDRSTLPADGCFSHLGDGELGGKAAGLAFIIHNLSSLGIPYFSVARAEGEAICWPWLDSLPAVEESSLLRHVLSPVDLRVLVDGEAGKGVITR